MSRLKSMPAAGWFVAGVAVTILLVPTTVGAVAAMKFVGIEGTSSNKADVTGAGQLLTAPVDPSAMFQDAEIGISEDGVTSPPRNITPLGSTTGLIVTMIHVDVDATSAGAYVTFTVNGGPNCGSGAVVGTYSQSVNPAGPGATELDLSPGLPIPAGDELCGVGAGATLFASVSGYTVPASDVP